MLGLDGYQPVSAMPAITRDLSVAVSGDDDEETLGDRVRDSLGARASCVEEVQVLSATACEQLPAAAVDRLGASPGQQNLLIRVVLRDLDKTLTSEDANSPRRDLPRPAPGNALSMGGQRLIGCPARESGRSSSGYAFTEPGCWDLRAIRGSDTTNVRLRVFSR